MIPVPSLPPFQVQGASAMDILLGSARVAPTPDCPCASCVAKAERKDQVETKAERPSLDAFLKRSVTLIGDASEECLYQAGYKAIDDTAQRMYNALMDACPAPQTPRSPDLVSVLYGAGGAIVTIGIIYLLALVTTGLR